MRYNTYKHVRTGVIVEVDRGLKLGSNWVLLKSTNSKVVEVESKTKDVENKDQVIISVEPKPKENKEDDIFGLEWLNSDYDNDVDEKSSITPFSSYSDLVKNGIRVEGEVAKVNTKGGVSLYEFDGKKWRKK